uniref:EF-hand domain-containing protein n=1 Tax=Noccaea caerulescens TaxID=107243 RepID=A0A1J3FMS5_NOCCA
MGQVLDKLRGKEWRQKKVQSICDRVFDRFKLETGRANLTFEELYIAVLLVYNDINKRLPGPHFDPPSKDLVKSMITDCDINLDGEIDREEFVKFIELLTADTFEVVSQGLIISLVVAPTVAIATKKATEGVPGVGKVVQKLPTSVYASLVTLAVVWANSDTS